MEKNTKLTENQWGKKPETSIKEKARIYNQDDYFLTILEAGNEIMASTIFNLELFTHPKSQLRERVKCRHF